MYCFEKVSAVEIDAAPQNHLVLPLRNLHVIAKAGVYFPQHALLLSYQKILPWGPRMPRIQEHKPYSQWI